MSNEILFNDGAAYDRYMGVWSRLVGEVFLDWLALKAGLKWLDVGCGNGAFTQMLFERCAPESVEGIDPSEEQIAYAREYLGVKGARFQQGDAMALPLPDNSFDVAVMPLVIFFVPEPSQGVAEMRRVVHPGGLVSAYTWDMPGGGFPYAALQTEMREMGIVVPKAPNPEASRIEVLRDLWTGAGLEGVETKEITVQRAFSSLADYWETVFGGPSVGSQLKAMQTDALGLLKERMRAHLPTDMDGRITYSARANAIKGTVPTHS